MPGCTWHEDRPTGVSDASWTLGLRGGSDWHKRITKETYDILNKSELIEEWRRNDTRDGGSGRRPLLMADTLLLIAKLHHERYTDSKGQPKPDEVSLLYRQPVACSDNRTYGVWTNFHLDKPCMLLRANTLGIGGMKLGEFCRRGEKGRFRFARQDTWSRAGINVDCVLDVNLPGNFFFGAGVRDILENSTGRVIGMEDMRVELAKVMDAYGEKWVDGYGQLQNHCLLKITVWCSIDAVYSYEVEQRMLQEDFLERLTALLTERLHWKLEAAAQQQQVMEEREELRLQWHAKPLAVSLGDCEVCGTKYLNHVVLTDQESIDNAERQVDPRLLNVTYDGAIPLDLRVQEKFLLFSEPEETEGLKIARRLANLDFDDEEEVKDLQRLGYLEEGDLKATMKMMENDTLFEECINNTAVPAAGPEPGTEENPLPSDLGPGINGSFFDPIAFNIREFGHADGGRAIKDLDEETLRELREDAIKCPPEFASDFYFGLDKLEDHQRAMLKPKSKFDVEPQQSKKVKRSASGEDWRVDFFKNSAQSSRSRDSGMDARARAEQRMLEEAIAESARLAEKKKKKGDQQEQVEKGEHDEEMQEMESADQPNGQSDMNDQDQPEFSAG